MYAGGGFAGRVYGGGGFIGGAGGAILVLQEKIKIKDGPTTSIYAQKWKQKWR